jgi:CheY-like chemotaxis protein
MSKKRVIDCGNCGPDHSSISRLLRSLFDVEIVQTNTGDETLVELRRQRADLVLVNRKLDIDYSDGMKVIEQLKSSEDFAEVPVMLVTNHDEYQQQAVAAGALYGFGKLELSSPKTKERLTAVLGDLAKN